MSEETTTTKPPGYVAPRFDAKPKSGASFFGQPYGKDRTGQHFDGKEWIDDKTGLPISGGVTTAATNPATQPPVTNPLVNLPGQLSPSTTLALNDMNVGIGTGTPQMGTNPNMLPAPAAPRPFYPVNGKLFGGSLFGRMNLKGY